MSTGQDAVDTALQFYGGRCVTKELPIDGFYDNVPGLRIIDGLDEVHKWIIAREAFDDNASEGVDHITRYDR